MQHPQGPPRTPLLAAALVVAVAAVVVTASAGTAASPIKVGLITKTEDNPFFVKMKQGATATAKETGAQLITAAGKSTSDNAGEITAIENMVTAGVKGILITPSDAKAQ